MFSRSRWLYAVRRLRVVHVVPAFYPATQWGGPIQSVHDLCNALADRGEFQLRVLTTDAYGPGSHQRLPPQPFPVRYPHGYDVYFCSRMGTGTLSPGLLTRVLPMVRWADVVHLTGVYSTITLTTLLACRLLHRPLVWSPRGALQSWEGNSRPGLKRWWDGVCDLLIRHGACWLHVTSLEEAGASSNKLPKAEIAIIPNGVEVPVGHAARSWRLEGRLRLLFVGRLHQKKGVENLLHALTLPGAAEASLVVCGAGEQRYVEEIQTLVKSLGLEGVVRFAGHVVGDAKEAAFRDADVCVVPSVTENFGMVVAEALIREVPVIVATGTPWAGVNTHKCGLWVESSPGSLARAISEMRERNLSEMGKNGRNWMIQDFSWASIADKMAQLYRAISLDRRPPSQAPVS